MPATSDRNKDKEKARNEASTRDRTEDGKPAENAGQAPQILFYHLERAGLMDVLPALLDKSLARGWRIVVQGPTRQKVNDLNSALWLVHEDRFLPHGTSDDGFSGEQPIYLTEKDDNPNGATIRFFVEGAEPEVVDGYERIVYLFDGGDEEAVIKARRQWKRFAGDAAEATYWKQNEQGSWEKKA